MGTEAIIGGLFGLASAGVSAASAHHTQSANAAAQANLNRETMNFNRVESAKARKWQAEQSGVTRLYNTREALAARQFTAKQAELMMDFNSVEAAKARRYQAEQNAVTRKFDANQAELARQFNAQQSYLAQQFEERMSSTAHQREVQDLKKAGLNPILSATGGNGASTPVMPILSSPMAAGPASAAHAASAGLGSSAQASAGSPSGAAASIGALNAYAKKNVIGDFLNSALDLMRVNVDLKKAEAQDKQANAAIKNAQTNEARQKADEKYIDQQIENLKKDNTFKDWQIKSEEEKVHLIKQQIVNAIKHQENEDRLTSAQENQANAIAYQAVRNADTEAAYKSKMAEVAEAKTSSEKRKLEAEADQIKIDLFSGKKKLDREFHDSNLGRSVYVVDKIVGALTPIKLFDR